MKSTVDFFVIGVQKAGTTALAYQVGKLSGIQMSRRKETHFFDDESRDWTGPNLNPSGLHKHFDWSVPGVKRGEATPITAFWPNALERLKQYNPDARLILILRDPVLRAFSQWKMQTVRGQEELSFEAALSPTGRGRIKEGGENLRRYSYVERGLYGKTVTRILSLFSPANLLLLRTDWLWNNPTRTLEQVARHLGVSPTSADFAGEKVYRVPSDTRILGELDSATRRRLLPMFTADLRVLRDLTRFDVSDWLRPDYSEAPFTALASLSPVVDKG